MSDWPFVEYRTISSSERSAFSMGPFGSKITKENYISEGVPVVRGVNLAHGIFVDDDFVFIDQGKADELIAANVLPGDLIFTHRGTIGQVSMLPRKPRYGRYVLGSSQVKTRLDESVAVPEFYYYWFRSPEGQRSILANASTVGVPGIATPLTSIKGLRVPAPPLSTQRAVASVLEALDDKIAVNDRIATTADALIRAKYAWALQEGCRLMAMPAALRITFGAPFRSSEFSSAGDGIPLIRIRDLTTFDPQVWTKERLPRDLIVEPGETVAGMDAEFRPTFWLGDAGLLNQRVMHATSLVGGGPVLAREALRAPLARVQSYKTGTTVAHLNKSDLERLQVSVPAESAMAAFEKETTPLHGIIVSLSMQSRSLAHVRDTLLPELISGQLRVKDAEKVVEEAV